MKNFVNKKGVELTTNAIIIIVLAIIVMAVLLFVLGGKTKDVVSATSCGGGLLNGVCQSSPCAEGVQSVKAGCPESQVCCLISKS